MINEPADSELLDLLSRQNCTLHIAYGHSENMPTFTDIEPLGMDPIREQTLRAALLKLRETLCKESN